jgi:hypothetical protein
MTMICLYPSKKELKAAIGTKLKHRETSMFGSEYNPNGTNYVCNRPHLTGYKREFFAAVECKDGLIVKVS